MPDFLVFGGAIAETADFRENAPKMRPQKISAPAAGDAVATSWNMHNRIEKRGIDSVCAPLSIPEVSAPTDTTGPGKRQSGGHASEFRSPGEKNVEMTMHHHFHHMATMAVLGHGLWLTLG